MEVTAEMLKINTEGFVKRVLKPWGYEDHYVTEDLPYMFKNLHIDAGKRLSLQRHLPGETSPGKVESWVVVSGKAKVIWEDATGEMIETELNLGEGFTSVIGQKHRLVGITDCDIHEASSPEGDGTTERLEDDYNRPDETAEMRADPNRGWNPDK
ncbi:MAG: cupin [Candidatus Curtissbacteria bacterium]|nr:cupin [Candidatus Curtissbacteria bacterium]